MATALPVAATEIGLPERVEERPAEVREVQLLALQLVQMAVIIQTDPAVVPEVPHRILAVLARLFHLMAARVAEEVVELTAQGRPVQVVMAPMAKNGVQVMERAVAVAAPVAAPVEALALLLLGATEVFMEAVAEVEPGPIMEVMALMGSL
jgi:exosortase/archaeosortase